MEEDQISLDVNIDVDLLESIARKLDTLDKEADNLTIFRVPYKFRQSQGNLFEPSAVSIGPFHHGRTGVQTMEKQKWRFLQDFLSRGNHITLDRCLLEIKKLEERTRRCYTESVSLDSNSFVEMMLLDGCFVLEYFFYWYEHKLKFLNNNMFIFSDLLLLENQIPFFIVEKLCEIGLKADTRRDFRNHLVNVLAHAGTIVLDNSIVPNPPAEIHHLVHLYYHCSLFNDREIRIPCVPETWNSFRPSILTKIKYLLLDVFLWVVTRIFPERNFQSLPNIKYTRKSMRVIIPCATKLQNAGIILKAITNRSYHTVEIKFSNGVLRIPTLTITNESKILFANLVAFEQYKSDEMSTKLSRIALLLDSLLKTPEDVMILQESRILNNSLDSDEELIDFFNQICKGMVVENSHFLAELYKEVNRYREPSWHKRQTRWKRHKKQFIQDYFSSPWTAISLVAAVLVVLLTFVQAFFTVYAYYVPPS